ncbi:MAG: hypothetical protein HYT98_04955 [Candidatus Sungbacteria bacterium]|nr:hypothetical protein [Candidatus Sungbacteria bacterium]
MSKSGLPNSIRKFLRKEKARLRREILDSAEAERKITELVAEIFKKHNAEKL